MKTKVITIIVLLISITTMAQKAINYKAFIKDNLGNVVDNQNITIKFSILEGPEIAFADIVYVETHSVTTDANGIVIANIGEGNPETGFENGYGLIEWGSFFGSHFLKVQIDTGSGLIDMGTTEFNAVPYALYAESSNNSGLEAINEGNGTGRRLIGMNPENYGTIANFAVDLSYSPASSTTRGATGNYAAALGYQTTASGYSSFASGVNTIASGTQATAMGAGTVASGHSSVAMGNGTIAEAPNTTAIGLYNVGGGDPLLASATDPLFEIGNGQYVDGTNDIRTNALTVLRNGTVTAPSFDVEEITDPKSLITKEYADANYSGGSGTTPTGLEAIDEGNGTGWRLVGTDNAYYSNIGDRAVDLSYGGDPDYDAGQGAYGTGSVVLGQYTSAGNGSVAMGYNSTASGQYSTAMGNVTTASGLFSTTAGFYATASAQYSTAFGASTIADDQYGFVLGKFNDNSTSTNTLFQIGNGVDNSNRTNAFVVDDQGIVTAPSFDIAEITNPKALITKEYADANYSGGGSGTAPTGLEAIDEGNGIGWRLVGSNPDNYGNIGLNAKDLSYSDDPNEPYGATGANSFTAGRYTQASGQNSVALGFGTIASGSNSISIGSLNTASNGGSISLGYNIISDKQFLVAMGKFNNPIYNNTIFVIGNGVDNLNRSNALNIFNNGTITAPSFDISEITDPKALTTKEYVDANSASGLEAIDEGNGIGWRLKGSNPANYGNIGDNSVDLSYSFYASNTTGALGSNSFAVGYEPSATGSSSIAMGTYANASNSGSIALGFNSEASGESSVAIGYFANAAGHHSMAIGDGTIADDNNSTVVGAYNDNTTSTSTLFQVGNGTGTNDRSNAFTVLQNGNVGISTSTPSVRLQITDGSDASLNNGSGYLLIGRENNFNLIFDENEISARYNGAATVLLLQQDGGSVSVGGSVVHSSDSRLKRDIETLQYGLNEVLQLAPKQYFWKNRGEQTHKSLGLIAQEVQPIISGLVHTANDENNTLSVSYTELIPVLIKAIQEQQAIIDNQKQVISSQEQTNTKQTEALQALLERVEALEKQSVSTEQIKIAKN